MPLFEESWKYREEIVYKNLFGDTGKGIYVLDGDIFLTQFGQDSYDPRWLFYGVLASPPNPRRDSWLYISSGMSNPWEDDDPQEYSGLGVEFVLETNEEAIWPIIILQRMIAFNLLLAHGRMGDAGPLDYTHRIPLQGSVSLERPSELRNLVITSPTHYPSSFDLPSGRVDLFHFIGITDAERDYAKRTSSEELVRMLKQKGVYPLTTPSRQSLL